jgi:hypothetical protein
MTTDAETLQAAKRYCDEMKKLHAEYGGMSNIHVCKLLEEN